MTAIHIYPWQVRGRTTEAMLADSDLALLCFAYPKEAVRKEAIQAYMRGVRRLAHKPDVNATNTAVWRLMRYGYEGERPQNLGATHEKVYRSPAHRANLHESVVSALDKLDGELSFFPLASLKVLEGTLRLAQESICLAAAVSAAADRLRSSIAPLLADKREVARQKSEAEHRKKVDDLLSSIREDHMPTDENYEFLCEECARNEQTRLLLTRLLDEKFRERMWAFGDDGTKAKAFGGLMGRLITREELMAACRAYAEKKDDTVRRYILPDAVATQAVQWLAEEGFGIEAIAELAVMLETPIPEDFLRRTMEDQAVREEASDQLLCACLRGKTRTPLVWEYTCRRLDEAPGSQRELIANTILDALTKPEINNVSPLLKMRHDEIYSRDCEGRDDWDVYRVLYFRGEEISRLYDNYATSCKMRGHSY